MHPKDIDDLFETFEERPNLRKKALECLGKNANENLTDKDLRDLRHKMRKMKRSKIKNSRQYSKIALEFLNDLETYDQYRDDNE